MRRRRWLYRSEPERTEEALRQTIAELCQALSADRLQQVLRAARYAAEGRSFAVIDLALWRKPECVPSCSVCWKKVNRHAPTDNHR
ncbi:MAG: hypothetical protein BKPUNTRY_001041 [Candidatus Fervidibacter sp.]